MKSRRGQRAFFACVLVWMSGTTCVDGGPTGPSNDGQLARLALAPSFSAAAAQIYRSLETFGLAIDNLHVQVRPANTDGVAVKDTVVLITSTQDSVRVDLLVPVAGGEERMRAYLDLRAGQQVLFSATQDVVLRPGLPSTRPEPIELNYVGPGANASTLVVSPPSATIFSNDSVQLTPTAFDANQQSVPVVAIAWTVTDVARGTVSEAGLFKPSATRGQALVVGRLPTGLRDTASISVIPVPSQIALISGGAQSGTVGTALTQSIVVEARGADNLPVAGFPVSFAVTAGGGSLTTTSAISDASGRASTVLTLGTSAGTNTVTVTSGTGTLPVTATGNPGPATRLAVAQQPSLSVISGDALAVQPQVRLQDTHGNAVSNAGVAVTAQLTTAAGRTLTGTTTRTTNASGIAVFTDLVITGPAGTASLTFASGNLAGVTSSNIQVTAGAINSVSWINPAGGNWSTGANWSTGTPPTATEIAAITLAGTYTVTLDVDPTVGGLVLGGATGTQTLAGTSRTFTLDGVGTVAASGVLSLSSSTLAGPGTLTNQGTVVLLQSSTAAATTFSNQGQLLAHGTSAINGSLAIDAAGTLLVRGQNNGTTAALTVANGFTNNGLIELTTNEAGYTVSLTLTNGTLTNAAGATIYSAVGAGGPRTLAAQLNNLGTLDVDQPLTLARASSQHVNGGTIDLTTANLTVTQTGTTPSFTNTGTITLAAARTLTVTGGLLDVDAGTLGGTLTSTLVVNNAQLAFLASTVTIPMTLNATTLVGGAFTIPTGQTLTLLDGGLGDPLTVAGGGTLLTHGTVSLTGALTMPAATSTLRVRGQNNGTTAALTVANGFTNNGLIELTTNEAGYTVSVTVTNGTLTNAAGATIHSAVGQGGPRTLAAQLNNLGTLDVDQPLTVSRASSQHVNGGTIDLTTANLTVTQTGTTPSFTNTGAITLAAARTLTVTGGLLDVDAGLVSGTLTSTLVVNNAQLAFLTTTVTIPMTLNATTLVAGAFTIPSGQTLTLLDGGLSDPVAIQGGGTLLTHGTVSLTGALTMPAATSTLRVRGQNNGTTAALTVANGFVNNGLIDLTTADAGYTVSLSVTNGALTNSAGATIRSAVGAGGPRTIAAELDNQGTLDVDLPLTLARASSHHLNSGTIDLTTANLTVTQTGTTPSFTNTGTITLAAARTLTVTGGLLDADAGMISGTLTSTLVVNNAQLAFLATTVTIPMTLNATTLVGGAFTIPTGQTLTLLNGGLSDPLTVAGGGTLLTHGTVALTSISMPAATATLRVQGQNNGTTAALTVANGFANNGLIELTTIEAGYTVSMTVTNGELLNAAGATIRSAVGAGGPRTLAAQLLNQGTLDVDQPLTLARAGSQHINNGAIDLTAANLTVTQTGATPSFTNNSTVTLGIGRDLTITGGAINLGQGFINGPLSSTFTASGAALSMTPVNVSVPMTITTSTINGGDLTIANGQLVTLLNGSLSDRLVVQTGGTLLTHGTVGLTNSLAMQTGSILRVRGQNIGTTAALTVTNGFINNGLIELTTQEAGYTVSLAVTNGTLTNAAGATIRSATGAGGPRTLAAQLNNLGLLSVDIPLTIARPSSQHVNSGSIDLRTSSLTVTQTGTTPSFTNNSTVTLGTGQTMTVSGGTLNLGQGFITGPATSTFVVSNAAMAFTPPNVTVPMTLTATTIVGGNLAIGDAQTVTLLNGGLSDAVNIQSGGTLLTHGTVALNGTLTQNGTLRVQGQNIGTNAVLTVANGFTNGNLIELISQDAGYAVTLAVTNGTLTNGSENIIRSTVGAGGARTLAVQLDNNGFIEVDQPLTLARANSAHIHRSVINITNADMTVNLTGTPASFVNDASLFIPAGRTFTVNGGTVSNINFGLFYGLGTLNVAGSTYTNAGQIWPNSSGSAGILTIAGAYNQVAAGRLSIDIGGLTAGTLHDQLVVTGAANLGGALEIVIINGFNVASGQRFRFMNYGSRVGATQFASVPAGWTVQYSATFAELVRN